MPIGKKIQQKILKEAEATLHSLLEFAVNFRILDYLIRRSETQFREFELEVAHSPRSEIEGFAVHARRADFLASGSDFFHSDMLLGADELSPLIGAFPLDAAASSYVFTRIEIFGAFALRLVHPKAVQARVAWHQGIPGEPTSPIKAKKGQEAIAKLFDVSPEKVPTGLLRSMWFLKVCRNNFAHRGEDAVNFLDMLEHSTAVVCYLTFMLTSKKTISVSPFPDVEERFTKGT